MRFEYILLLASLISLTSCGNYTTQTRTSDSDLNNATFLHADFQTLQTQVFVRCLDCHQQFRTYAGVKNELGAIVSEVDADLMPKSGGPLTPQQKALLHAWVQAGAVEQIGQPNTPSVPEPLQPTWSSVSANVLLPRCVVCHSPNGQAKFLDLSTRASVFAARNRVLPAAGGKKLFDIETPDNSYVLEVIEDPDEPMPPVWSHIPRLTTDQISVLKQWIGLGFP